MSRKRGVTTKQVDAIRSYAHKGYSANQIQQKLSKQGIGLRRTILLSYVREFKRQPARPHIEKYTPTKYRPSKIGIFGKQLACYGTQHGRSKRIQMTGSGFQLYQAMLRVSKHPPKKQFLTVSAEALLDDPSKYLERGEWDVHPKVTS